MPAPSQVGHVRRFRIQPLGEIFGIELLEDAKIVGLGELILVTQTHRIEQFLAGGRFDTHAPGFRLDARHFCGWAFVFVHQIVAGLDGQTQVDRLQRSPDRLAAANRVDRDRAPPDPGQVLEHLGGPVPA